MRRPSNAQPYWAPGDTPSHDRQNTYLMHNVMHVSHYLSLSYATRLYSTILCIMYSNPTSASMRLTIITLVGCYLWWELQRRPSTGRISLAVWSGWRGRESQQIRSTPGGSSLLSSRHSSCPLEHRCHPEYSHRLTHCETPALAWK